MKVTTTLFFASCAFVAVAGTGGAALNAPASLQYDEIVRVVVGEATPPPPGSFKADLAAIENPPSDQTAQAPKKHGFGNILGAVLSGQNPVDAAAGNLADNAVANAMGGMLGSLNSFTAFMRQGKVARYTFYNGWERIEDTSAQTATITKNDLHQVIVLNLKNKTYRTSDPTAQSSTATSSEPSAPSKKSARTKEAPEEPGTAVVDFSREGTLLGHEVLENVPTTGYRNKVTLAMTQATGSCRNGSFSVTSSQYLAKLQEPQVTSAGTVSRPAPRVPTDPQSAVTRGGCKPTFTAHNSGVNPPSGRFIMYSLVAMQPQDAKATPAPNGGTFSFVTERGNVVSLTPSAAAPLFEIPSDFTPEK